MSEQLAIYLAEKNIPYVALIKPDDFVRWIFPRLFNSRLPRYATIADKYGYTITTEQLAEVNHEEDFLRVLEQAIAQQQ